MPFLHALKRSVRLYQLRRRFPHSVFHPGVAVSKDSRVDRYAVLFCGVSLESSTVGAYSYVQAGTSLTNAELGPFCSIAGGVIVGLASHPTNMVSTNPVFYDCAQPLPRFFTRQPLVTGHLPRTIIGADVWIGQNAMVKAGVHIGVGAVIGAGAIVTRNVPAYAIAAGVPARATRTRFAADLCRRLVDSRWWERSDGELEQLATLFSEPEKLVAALEHRQWMA